jgi:predicted anti-sigma-YlaC factor YlaD
LQCREVVELVTDYLEHALAIDDRNLLEQHLLICAPCATFIEQHATVARALAVLAEAPKEAPRVPADTQARALAAFRKSRAKVDP